jgi:hypothetical protein
MMLKRVPFHPFLFAAYPVLALLAHNISEVEAQTGVRPLLISLMGGGIIFLLSWLVLRDARRAGLVTTTSLVLFFSYGHLYTLLEGTSLLGFALGRHRYMLFLFLALLVAAILWAIKILKDTETVTGVFNIAGVILLAFPLYIIASQQITVARAGSSLSYTTLSQASGQAVQPLKADQGKPDIYYFILDTYTRADVLKDDLDYDNSPFLDELRKMGFYVADCSLSNYRNTLRSVTSSLNMDYLQSLKKSLPNGDWAMDNLWVLLKHSRVEAQLKALGYKIVAFDTGYEWSRLEDADYYLGLNRRRYELQQITPFEAMLIKSTALLPLIESQDQALVERFQPVNNPYSDHIIRQLFILDQTPKIAENPEPTFTFAHVLVTHAPYVFGPQGEFLTDRGFYGNKGYPVNEDYALRGYIDSVQYLDTRLLDLIHQIFSNSKTPPVIILQGDHGFSQEKRSMILNAYYLPGFGENHLYPAISPVNSFRVVFNTYFAAGLSLLPDISYLGQEDRQIAPETSPRCK